MTNYVLRIKGCKPMTFKTIKKAVSYIDGIGYNIHGYSSVCNNLKTDKAYYFGDMYDYKKAVLYTI